MLLCSCLHYVVDHEQHGEREKHQSNSLLLFSNDVSRWLVAPQHHNQSVDQRTANWTEVFERNSSRSKLLVSLRLLYVVVIVKFINCLHRLCPVVQWNIGVWHQCVQSISETKPSSSREKNEKIRIRRGVRALWICEFITEKKKIVHWKVRRLF